MQKTVAFFLEKVPASMLDKGLERGRSQTLLKAVAEGESRSLGKPGFCGLVRKNGPLKNQEILFSR